MASAKELAAQLRHELQPVERRLFSHPWIAAAEQGGLQAADLVIFAAHQERIIQSDLRSVALLVHRYAGTPSGAFFLEGLKTEAAALEALAAFARRAGAGPERLAAVTPVAGALAYTHFLAWLAAYGSDAEFAAAFLVNLPAWGANCGRLSRAFQARYRMAAGDVAFFELFARESPGFDTAALAVIQAGLDRGVPEPAIRHAALLLQQYELMYWDGLQAARAEAPSG
ncbi:MAG: hypothetical protein ACE147_11090 [Candidatus Methylomirabilales bacterium]